MPARPVRKPIGSGFVVDLERGDGRVGGSKTPRIGDPPNERAIAAVVWTVLIFAACWFPRQNLTFVARVGQSYPMLRPDKLVHGLLFAGFGWLWLRALPGSARTRAIIFTAGLAMAPITEFGQLMPWVGRDAGWGDGLADVVGLLVGYSAALLIPNRTPKGGAARSDREAGPGRPRGL